VKKEANRESRKKVPLAPAKLM